MDIERRKTQLTEMRVRLIAAVQNIEQSIIEDVRSPGQLSNAPTHLANEGEEGVDENVTLAENEEGLLEQVEAALQRIEDGRYGRCEKCRRPIGDERLEVLPFARYCIRCAPRQE